MPVSFDFLRGVLGVLAIFFTYLAGRSAAFARKGKQKISRFYGWFLRAAICIAGASIRHPLGPLDLAIWLLCAAAFGFAWWEASRERPSEDLTREIFPE
ncbi:MAG: hypothetical protein JO323_17305 [Acidobacteriia bacterium]|nr:hypothetical protein [Terriglobia bacterium]